MQDDDVGDALELLDRRYRFLERIEEGPAHVRDLTDSLGVSRSTVNRGVRELSEAGWIRRTTEGYAVTTAGALVLNDHRNHRAALEAVQSNQGVFEPLPPETPLEPGILADATIDRSDEYRQYELIGKIHDLLGRAESFRALWPVANDDRSLTEVAAVADRGGEFAIAAEPELTARLRETKGVAEGVDAGTVTVEPHDSLPECLGVIDCVTDSDRRLMLVLYSPNGGIHAVVETETESARRWTDDLFRRYLGTGATVGVSPNGGADTFTAGGPETGDRPAPTLPKTLGESGFLALTPEYFDTRETLPPETMLRAGPGLPEVAAGMTLSREHVVDDERRDFVDHLVSSIEDGSDTVLLGLPGSGKSTCCKQAACRWWAADNGPVFYREGGRSSAIDDPSELAAELQATDGHALVVVEDAPRSDAMGIFTVIQELAGEADVSFLLDARRSEWADPDELLDARLEVFRQDEISTASVPPLDDRERDRFHAHAADLLPGSFPPREEFTTAMWDDDDDAEAGELLILSHRYGLFADPFDDGGAVTSLSQDVRHSYAAVSDDPDELVVAMFVNTCNAAGLPVTRDLVYALAVDPDGPALDTVDAALDRLDGQVLFGQENSHFRTVHDAWSTAFLDEVVSSLDQAVAHRRFARAVNALLALADDPARRERIRSLRQGDAPVLEQLEAAPETWAETVAERVFALGRETPGLAPLYGHGRHADLQFPDACQMQTVHSCLVARARMYSDAGDYDAAMAECEFLDEVASTVSDADMAALLRARANKIRSYVADRRGDFDDAWEYGLSSLEGFREAGDRQGEARALNGVGVVAWLRGEVDEAKARFEAALEIHDELTDLRGEADVRNNLGMIQRERGDLAGAVERFEESHELRHAIGARVQAIDSLINLGVTARDVGALDTALARFRQAIEESKTVGARERESHAHRALGNTYRRTGDYEKSRESLERARTMTRDQDNRYSEMLCLRGLAATARAAGRLDDATEHVTACLEMVEELGDERDEALALACRGGIAHDRGNEDDAIEDLSTAVDMLESLDRAPGLAETYRDYAAVCAATGAFSDAFEAFEAATDRYETVGATPYLRDTLEELVEVAEAAEDADRAETYRDRLAALDEE
ncbi:tetratricopeptide repeat protein [Haloarchaeobius sp. HME9146]|uniref:tetratricopeptide repeat protein n=1 Tax=Haloarchaeobius sp. HME9146 TaxID=2978732 RepID=UPI0021C211B9|nr:tetratricopeptide repeat protein [Haloarchaeobius sp. HME9146]MCT9098287.1 tetratricopeptide repeat protein [Haloarchaeobius sp. HME9146]